MPMGLPPDPRIRFFPFIEASPSAVLDLVQAPVMLYMWIVLPILVLAYWILVLLYLFCLPFPRARRRMRARLSGLTLANANVHVSRIEGWALQSNWSTCLFVILLGTPLVAMLCVLYGHHVISGTAYDSNFQYYSECYGFVSIFLSFFPLTAAAYFFGSDHLYFPLFSLIAALTVAYGCVLIFVYFSFLLKGIRKVIRWHLYSIGAFTVLQPFIFRFLRYDALPMMGFSKNAPPIFGYNATYLIAFFLPCLVYALAGIILHRRLQRNLPPWFVGLHTGLLFLSILAADLH